MKEQFTPGEWKYVIEPTELAINYTIQTDLSRNRKNLTITTLNFIGIDETQANANLIEAAPNMYEVLKDFISLYNENKGMMPVILRPAIKAIQVALSKANPQI